MAAPNVGVGPCLRREAQCLSRKGWACLVVLEMMRMNQRDGRRGHRGKSGFLKAAALLALLSVSALPQAAMAQATSFYLDRLRIGGAPEDPIGAWRPEMGEVTRVYGQLGVGFASNPFRVENYVDAVDQRPIVEAENGPPVSKQLITYFTVGAEIGKRASVGVSFPLAVYQTGNPTVNQRAQIDDQPIDLQTVAPMDLRLDGRFMFWSNEAKSIKLGVQGALFIPTGNELSFGGDGKLSGSLGLAAEYNAGFFYTVLNTGIHFHPKANLNEFNRLHEITYGLAAFVPLKDDMFRVGAQIFGTMGVGAGTFGDVDNIPIEWMAEGRARLGSMKQFYVGLGAGTRITAGYAPDFRGMLVIGTSIPLEEVEVKNDKGFRYKIPVDTDKDGIADDIDMCPSDAEDKQGHNTDDGCPEMLNDADSDGVPDAEDACPSEPGVRSPDPAKNGCPEFIRRIKGSSKIEVLKEVQFAFDRADLRPEAYPILNEVVRLLRVNPDIELVSIEGHTDDFGTEQHNNELSEARARSVLNYLVQRGIAGGRLTSKGYGESKPIAPNTTDEGRAKNRRVEFHILKIRGAAQPAPANPPPANPPPASNPPPANPPPPAGGPTNAAPPAASPAPAPSGSAAKVAPPPAAPAPAASAATSAKPPAPPAQPAPAATSAKPPAPPAPAPSKRILD